MSSYVAGEITVRAERHQRDRLLVRGGEGRHGVGKNVLHGARPHQEVHGLHCRINVVGGPLDGADHDRVGANFGSGLIPQLAGPTADEQENGS